jgi:hypothetical protein
MGSFALIVCFRPGDFPKVGLDAVRDCADNAEANRSTL